MKVVLARSGHEVLLEIAEAYRTSTLSTTGVAAAVVSVSVGVCVCVGACVLICVLACMWITEEALL